jgi:glutamine amidotransferase
MRHDTVIVDSGGANISSLIFALHRLRRSASLTSDPDLIRRARRVILPGVGAARDAMQRLRELQLLDVIRKLEQPVLGICLGMQLLMDASEEDNVECLGVIPGVARKLPGGPLSPVPNMGWCRTRLSQPHAVLEAIDDGEFFYYLHSYAVPITEHTIATSLHSEPFSALLSRNNFTATQFHPERSAAAGSQLLANFLGR